MIYFTKKQKAPKNKVLRGLMKRYAFL